MYWAGFIRSPALFVFNIESVVMSIFELNITLCLYCLLLDIFIVDNVELGLFYVFDVIVTFGRIFLILNFQRRFILFIVERMFGYSSEMFGFKWNKILKWDLSTGFSQ